MVRRPFLSLLVLIFLPLMAIVAADENLYKPGTDVLVLTEETFEEKIIKQDGPAFVQFYSPNCGACVELVEDYEKAAKVLKGQATVAAINAKNVSQKMLDEYGITKGFPRIYVFTDDRKNPRKYVGERSAQAMKKHLELLESRLSDALLPKGRMMNVIPASTPEKSKKAAGCGCKKNKGEAAVATADGAAPCPHCGKSEPDSCSKCAGKAEAAAVEKDEL